MLFVIVVTIVPVMLAQRLTRDTGVLRSAAVSLGSVPSERDLFANFERMRREMDELFGDVFDRGLAAPPRRLLAGRRRLLRRRSAARGRARRPRRHRPRRGRAGDPRARARPRRPAPAADERRRARLPAARDRARRRSGASSRSAPTSTPTRRAPLRGRHARSSSCRSPARAARAPSRSEPAEPRVRSRSSARPRRPRGRDRRPPRCPTGLPVLPLRDTVTFPDTLTPLAVGQERSIQLVNDVLARQPDAGDGRQPRARGRGARARTQLYDVGVVGTVARMLKVPDGTLRILVQGGQRVRIDDTWPRSPTWSRAITELPDVVERGPGADGADAQRPADVLAHHRGGPVPARGAADGGRQPRGPLRARRT